MVLRSMPVTVFISILCRMDTNIKQHLTSIFITFLLLTWAPPTSLVRPAMMQHGFWPWHSTIPSLV